MKLSETPCTAELALRRGTGHAAAPGAVALPAVGLIIFGCVLPDHDSGNHLTYVDGKPLVFTPWEAS